MALWEISAGATVDDYNKQALVYWSFQP